MYRIMCLGPRALRRRETVLPANGPPGTDREMRSPLTEPNPCRVAKHPVSSRLRVFSADLYLVRSKIPQEVECSLDEIDGHTCAKDQAEEDRACQLILGEMGRSPIETPDSGPDCGDDCRQRDCYALPLGARQTRLSYRRTYHPRGDKYFRCISAKEPV